MTRKELYEKVKSMNLQEEVKKVYADNYTRCPSAVLEDIVEKAMRKEAKKKNPVVRKTTKKTLSSPKSECPRFDALIDILFDKRILLKSEVDKIRNV